MDLDIILEETDNYNTFEAWFYRLNTWLRLGEMFLQDGEIILSKEAYMVFETRLAEKQDVIENNPTSLTDITVEAYLNMARVQMEMKLPTQALRYAEMAFELNHFHPDARMLLASYSPQYDRELNHEVRVFHGFTAIWRQRFMTRQYLKDIKREVVADLEAKLAINHLDRKVSGILIQY